MIVLDENVFDSQRVELARRLRICQVGYDIGRKGMQDGEIIALLLAARRPTFFTRDRDFYNKSLCHSKHCLVWLDVRPLEAADYVRRLLRHPEFKTWSQRQGCVARVSASGISVWRSRVGRPVRHRWPDRR